MGGGPAPARTTLRGSTAQRGARESGGEPADRGGALRTLPQAPHRQILEPDSVNNGAGPPGGGPEQPSTDHDAAKRGAGSNGALWARFREDPCDDARNDLVVAYQPLVGQIIRRFATRLPRTVDRGDLSTAANVGLISAIHGFDPERGVRFESYCELRVKGALLDELRSQDWLPRPWRHKIEQQKRTLERLRTELGREPSDGEIASSMGLAMDVYQQTFGTGLPGTSGSATSTEVVGEDGSSVSALDVVPDRDAEVPGESLSRDEMLKLVGQRMTDQERRIVYLKYWEELPMREIGELTGLSESRVCKIHTRLIERMQDRFRVGVETAL